MGRCLIDGGNGIHDLNKPGWIGHAVSSGCIRRTNEDVIDLYSRGKKSALVVVLGPQQGRSAIASRCRSRGDNSVVADHKAA